MGPRHIPKEFLDRKHCRIISSQIVEDCFNRQKRAKAGHMNRKVKVQSSWDVLQERRLVDKVHEYKLLAVSTPGPLRADRLPEHTFSGPLKGTTLDLSGITGHTAKTSWYSPSAERNGVAFMDTVILDFAIRRQCLGSVGNACLSILANPRHRILLREVVDEETGEFGPPFFACGHIPGSVAWGWPAEVVQIPMSERQCFVPAKVAAFDQVPLVIIDPSHWVALQYCWRSPAWQWETYPLARQEWLPSIRAFSVGDTDAFKPLMVVAAESAFWGCSNDEVRRLAKLCGIAAPPPDASLFDTCTATVMGITQCSAEKAVEYLQNRAVEMQGEDTALMEIVLEADECVGMLDPDDAKEVRHQQQQVISRASQAEKFVTAFRSYKAKVKPPAPATTAGAQQGKPKPRSSRNAKKDPQPSKYPPWPASGMTQSMASAMPPPRRVYLARPQQWNVAVPLEALEAQEREVGLALL